MEKVNIRNAYAIAQSWLLNGRQELKKKSKGPKIAVPVLFWDIRYTS